MSPKHLGCPQKRLLSLLFKDTRGMPFDINVTKFFYLQILIVPHDVLTSTNSGKRFEIFYISKDILPNIQNNNTCA